jgi:sugar lactone lactonase YvrE
VAGGNGRGSAANQLFEPIALALDSNGDLYIADLDNDRVQRWAPGATTGATAANQLGFPTGVALDTSRNLYITEYDNQRVLRWALGPPS